MPHHSSLPRQMGRKKDLQRDRRHKRKKLSEKLKIGKMKYIVMFREDKIIV
jgi:hypothetical protein